MASTPPDILKHKLFKAPDSVRARVDELILDYKCGAITIINKFVEEDPEGARHLPTANTLHKYVLWRRANPTLYSLRSKQVNIVAEAPEESNKLIATAERVLAGLPEAIVKEPIQINYELDMLSDSKQTLEYLKRTVAMKIQEIEGRQQENYDKYAEQNLVNLFKILKDLVHSEVKLAEELKDSEKIPVADVKVSIHKLFDAVYMTVDRIMPEKKAVFQEELTKVLSYYRSNLLTEIKPEEKV